MSLTMEDNIDWLFDETHPCVDCSLSNHDLRTEVKCEACCEDQLHDGTLVKAETCVKEEVQVKEEKEDNALTDMEEKVCRVFDETLASEDWTGCDPLGGSEETEEADFEEQVPDGTGVETVSTVKEEVQVKEEREDQSGVMQSLSFPAGCGACDYKCGRAEESFEYRGLRYVLLGRVTQTGLGLAKEEHGMEGVSVSECKPPVGGESSEGVSTGSEGGKNKKRRRLNCNLQPYVLLKKLPEIVLRLAQREQSLEGVSVSEGQQAVGGGSSEGVSARKEGGMCKKRRQVKCYLQPHMLLRRLPETGLRSEQGQQSLEGVAERSQALHPEVNVDKRGDVRSPGGRQEKGGRDVERECVGHGLVSLEDYQVEVNGGCCEDRGVTRLGEGERQEEEEGVHLQARAESSVTLDNPSVFVAGMSTSSWASVASSSSSPEVPEPGPGVSGQETDELSPLKKRQYRHPRQKQQRRKKGPVQSTGSVVHEEAGDVCGLHGNVQTLPEGVRRQRQACPHCEFRCAKSYMLTRHVERCHAGLKRLSPSHCSVSSRKRKNLREGNETTPGGSRELQCPHCPYKALSPDDFKAHKETVHKDLKKYKCSQCQFTTARKSDLQRHTETVHEGLRRYPCPHCPYRAGQKSTLQKHAKTVHQGLRKYKCSYCPYRAGQSHHLQMHVETVHEGSRKFKCSHCSYSAGRIHHLQTHVETVHEGLRKYKCPHCSYRAGQISTLKQHVHRKHEGKM